MASPNASLAQRLQQSPTYAVLGETYRQAWLQHCLKLGEDRISKPRTGEVFRTLPNAQMSKSILGRLNDYGIAAGCEFVTKSSDFKHWTPNITFLCSFHGTRKANKHKLKDELVRVDPITGERVSDRQRNKDDSRLGCTVKYKVSFKDNGSGERQWIGHWTDDDHRDKHPFPFSPIEFSRFKKVITDYQHLEAVGRKYRSARVPYSEARRLFAQEGTRMLMSQKEYYNLACRRIKDIITDNTAGALCAVFDRDNWQYSLRTEETAEGGYRIVQVFFWYTASREFIRRFTSNSLLIVDGTFRTNNQGMPLLIAVGKSNTQKSFPVAF
jgi:hypothetical protein